MNIIIFFYFFIIVFVTFWCGDDDGGGGQWSGHHGKGSVFRSWIPWAFRGLFVTSGKKLVRQNYNQVF